MPAVTCRWRSRVRSTRRIRPLAAVWFVAAAASLAGCKATMDAASPIEPVLGSPDAGTPRHDAGSASGIPAPPDDSCGRFGWEFGGSVDCEQTTCDPVVCDCAPTPYRACSPRFGCGVAVDCEAACTVGIEQPDDVTNCVEDYAPCTMDADCTSDTLGAHFSVCVIRTGEDRGECATGFAGSTPTTRSRCIKDTDCVGGFCVAVAQDGRRECSSGASVGHPCNRDEHCPRAGAHCALPDGSFLGRCTAGRNGESCFRDADCETGLQCRDPVPESGGTCADAAATATTDAGGAVLPGTDAGVGGGCSACTLTPGSDLCGGERPVLWECFGPFPSGGLPAVLGTDCTDLATNIPRYCCPHGLRAECPAG